MNENIKHLRKEAYKVWGISTKEVIYDIPKHVKRTNKDKFYFKINFSKDYKSWPRAYKLSAPTMNSEGKITGSKTFSRVIVPIILFKNYDGIKFESEAWYDMPEDMHVEMLLLTENSVYRKTNPLKKLSNLFLRGIWKQKEEIPIEKCVFEVSKYNKEFEISII